MSQYFSNFSLAGGMKQADYQNPLHLLRDPWFVKALSILGIFVILEVVIGLLYSTYCSYPHSVMRRSYKRVIKSHQSLLYTTVSPQPTKQASAPDQPHNIQNNNSNPNGDEELGGEKKVNIHHHHLLRKSAGEGMIKNHKFPTVDDLPLL
jgi:hypothetical protein